MPDETTLMDEGTTGLRAARGETDTVIHGHSGIAQPTATIASGE